MTRRTLAEYRLPWRIVGANMAQAHVERRLNPPPQGFWLAALNGAAWCGAGYIAYVLFTVIGG